MSFLSMHGYAIYIWPAYGFVFGLLLANILNTCLRGKRIKQQLREWLNLS